MTKEQQDLIQEIQATNVELLEAMVKAFAIDDPLSRYQAIEDLETHDHSLFILRKAKALTLRMMKESNLSDAEIGTLLGVSRQRVHQLMNPTRRKKF